jgi:hypothetical protein
MLHPFVKWRVRLVRRRADVGLDAAADPAPGDFILILLADYRRAKPERDLFLSTHDSVHGSTVASAASPVVPPPH